jgi:uncharacterized membrane protein
MRLGKLNIEQYLIFLILLVGAIMRLWGIGSDFSFSNDELSALTRLQFDSFSELIQLGITEGDMHPAGVQLFLYFWTKVFGISQFAVRLPFVICGIASLYLVYRIGKMWFNANAGLIAAAILCTLEYTILYSQIARPYAPGLFFSLLVVYFWTKLFFDKQPPTIITYAAFALSVIACMYTHYYASFFAAMVCATGVFFLNRNNWKPYLLCGLGIVILYLPHLSITQQQLAQGAGGLGGETGWLPPPEEGWFSDYMNYVFNNSTLLMAVIFTALLTELAVNFKQLKWNRFYVIGFAWFLVPFLFGYLYSIAVSPIIQFSVLLFSFPYFILLIAGLMSTDNSHWKKGVAVMVLLIAGAWSTIEEDDFYAKNHFGEFRALASQTETWNRQFGVDNITRTININHRKYIQYYLNRNGHSPVFETYQTKSREDLVALQSIVNEAKTPYFMFGWSTVATPLEIYGIIRAKYPHMVEDKVFFNSRISLFTNQKPSEQKSLFHIKNDFEQEYPNWNGSTEQIDTSNVFSGTKALKLDAGKDFSHTWSIKGKDWPSFPNSYLSVSCMVNGETNASAQLVVSFERDGKPIKRQGNEYWFSSHLEDYASPNEWGKIIVARKLPRDIQPGDEIKVYLWHTNQETVFVDDFSIDIYPIHEKGKYLIFNE